MLLHINDEKSIKKRREGREEHKYKTYKSINKGITKEGMKEMVEYWKK